MATAKPVTDGQECVSLWQAGLLVYWSVWGKKYSVVPDYNHACITYGYTPEEWAKLFDRKIRDTMGPRYYVLVEDDNEE